MINTILLLMTPGMSLKRWDGLGQLSRELWFYRELCNKANADLIIYSYGRDDERFLHDFPRAKVLNMHSWIPTQIPFRLQNVIYNFASLIIYRKYFKKIKLSKTNQFSASVFGLLLKAFFGIPLVIRMGYYHSHFKSLSERSKWKEKILFRVSDLILTTSSEAAEFISRTYKIAPRKIMTLCNSIDLNRFKPINIGKEYDILFVGRLEKVKNLKLLLTVIEKVKLKTLIIGNGSLSPSVLEAIGSNPLLTWKERVDNLDLPVYYNQSKSFLILSEYEGNPKALLESMACGIPSIATNVPGIRECIENGISGILLEADADLITKELTSLCSDPERLAYLGYNAQEWVQSNADFQKNILKEVTFYSSLLNN